MLGVLLISPTVCLGSIFFGKVPYIHISLNQVEMGDQDRHKMKVADAGGKPFGLLPGFRV